MEKSTIEERILEEVERYENLYNPTLREYKDAQMTNNSWREISAAVGVEATQCIKIWRRLRDRFVREKKGTKGRSGDAGGKKVWALYHRMLWLDVHVKHRETTSNFDNKGKYFSVFEQPLCARARSVIRVREPHCS